MAERPSIAGDLASIADRFRGLVEVESKLGQGAMGAVYKVRRGTAIHALKVMLPGVVGDQANLERFMLEGKILQTLDHPHILKVHAVGSAQGMPYMLCEFVDGGCVGDLLGSEPLSWERAFAICEEVLSALTAAHDQKIFHRDIKPSNILLTRDGRTKLADFGIAKAEGESFEARKTTTGIILGTPAYIAPEVLRGKKTDPRSDLYSVGVMLFELIAGELPWRTDDPQEILTARLQSRVPRLSQRLTGVPKSIDTLLLTALATEPRDRFPSAGMFRTALVRTREQLLRAHGSAVSTSRIKAGETVTSTAPSQPAGEAPTTMKFAKRAPAMEADQAELDRLAPPRGPRPSRVVAAEPGPPAGRPVMIGAALLGLVTVGAIALASAGRPPQVIEVVSRGAYEEPGLTEGEQREVAEAVDLLFNDPGSPLLAAALGRYQERDRGAIVLYHIWKGAPSTAKATVLDPLVKTRDPLALPALVQVLSESPDAAGGRRRQAAEDLMAILRDHPEALGFPDAPRVLIPIGSILKNAATYGQNEDQKVVQAAIRLLGWLGMPQTSDDCIRAMLEAPTKVGWIAGAVPGSDPDREIRIALERIRTPYALDELARITRSEGKSRLDRLGGT